MERISEKIKNWVKETTKIKTDFVLTHPKDIKNGDYSFFAPAEFSEKFTRALNENKIPEVEKVESAGRFINFYLSKEFFSDSVKEINKKGEKFGNNNLFEGQKIMVEYTDPNPLKEFHIGHLMSNTIGETISRIVVENGAEVKRANWQGDVGIHIAYAVWGIKKKGGVLEEGSVKEKAKYLGECYALGATSAKKDESLKPEMEDINKKIYEKSDDELNKYYEWGRKISLDYFEAIYERLGTKFDYYFFESKEGVEGKPVVEAHLDDGIFEKSDGAVIFRGEKYGLHTRVFINSHGIPTYETKELGLNKKKFEVEPGLSKSIIITGNEIKEYFKVLLKVISLILPEVAEKTLHIPHGMLRLPTGKMSSRTGDVITAESLIEKVKEEILNKLEGREYSNEEKNEIAEIVAIGAIKYSILRQAIGGDIIFDFEKSISFEGDSGPYLQYAAVRANSVLQKAVAAGAAETDSGAVFSEGKSGTSAEESVSATENHQDWQTTELERYLYRFPEIVERAGNPSTSSGQGEYAPHYIVTYLTELAAIFNSFYAKEKIIDEGDASSPYKIALTQATSYVLKSGLHILGMKVPHKM